MPAARAIGCLAVVAATLGCTQDFEALLTEGAAGSATGAAGAGNGASSTGGGGHGAGGMGGAGSGAGGQGGAPPICPNGAPLKGAPMVGVPAESPYCIDVREVSNSDFSVFLSALNMIDSELPACAWNDSAKPAQLMTGCTGGIPATPFDEPVVCVDWCDAWEFCHWAGKRLCGAIEGAGRQPTPFDSTADASQSEWYRACSRAGTQEYPYGVDFESGECNDASATLGVAAPVTSFPDCVGGYDGIFDMSGNVKEWENSCNGAAGMDDLCHHRSGSFASSELDTRCQTAAAVARKAAFSDVGFRCCLDP
jgi:formylglycine-generating enzyme required for sulfatase activity